MTDTESDIEVSLEDSGETKNILYDIVTYKEWEQEPEVQRNGGSDRSDPASAMSKLWRSSGQMTPVVPASVERLRQAGLSWQLAVSPDAGLIAVLGDTCLEVWSSKDNYTHLLGRRPVERDPAPQWRHVLWTRDCQLLALASSSGHVEVCDTLGGHVYHVISPRIAASQPGWVDSARSGPLRTSYAGVFFTEVRIRDVTRDTGWVSEMVVCEVSGAITSFLVSLSGYQELSRYDLGWSVTSAALCPTLGLLITSGSDSCPLTCHRSLVGKASHAGLVTLRLVSQEPHYVILLDEFEQSLLTSSSWLRLPSLISSSPTSDPILTMTVSDCGGKLAAVHVSGTLTVWRLPSLLLESSSRLEEQPQFDEVNPALLQHSSKRKAKAEFLANPLRYHPVGVAWWSKDNLVVARISGAVTVLQMTQLDNLLGDNPEFLEGVPRISQCFQKGFFALECELVVRGRRVSAKESAGEDPDEDIEAETDEEEEDGWLGLGKRSAAALAYFITDSERFAPPKKKSKVVRRTYRLLALVSTSPEELYNRKILLEEYGEAIMLAQHYGLDTDSVYRRQWQQSNKSGAAIQDYLTKIKRRNEVIRECLETIPDDIDAARELLKYGLRATDLEALVALNKQDDGALVLADIEGDRKTNILGLTSQVRWESLSLSQKELIKSRVKMLYYLDCLDTLEEILGGGRFAADKFTPAHFRQLRSHSPLENCALAARRGDTITVECLMSGSHAAFTADHWLAIISNFPETLAPSQYSALLPRMKSAGAEVEELYRQEPRAPDWCEGALALKWGGPGVRREWDTEVLYTDQELRRYTGARLSPGQVSQWYCYRARRCVTVTSLPDTGLELLTLGLERGADVHWDLLHNLRTLDCLVYEVQNISVDLAKLETMETVDIMEMLLRGHHTVTGVRRFLQPFLQRLEDAKPGEMRRLVSEYCVTRAEEDLSFPLVVVENSGPDKTGPVLYSVVDTIRLALDCCYAHKTGNQLELAESIYFSIISYFKENPGTRQLKYNVSHMKQEVEMFKNHLEISRILSKNGVVKPLSHLRDHSNDKEVMKKIFDAVTARAEGARPPLDQDGWRLVLRDLQCLQNLVPVVEMTGVMLGYTESLLSSGSHSNIELAGSVMEGLIDTGDSLQLVLTAWRHYYSTASSLSDPDIDLARKCLSLAPDGVREIQDCYDLIAALQSLADFGLSDLLPVTVLNCQDRMEFVRRAVQTRHNAYKNTQRLMKLASLLKVCHGESVEGVVWDTIARRALQVGDISASRTACNNFILAGHTAGWDICYALAARPDFGPDLERCRELLAFSASHCDPENIGDVLQTILTVEQRSITKRIESKIVRENTNGEADNDEEEIFDDAVENAEDRESREVSPMSTVLSIPSLTSQFLTQHQAAPAAVWQLSSSWLSQLSSSNNNIVNSWSQHMELDKDFTSARFPAFYSSLFKTSESDDYLVSGLDACYTKFTRPVLSQDLSVVSLQLLRLNFLSQTLSSLSDSDPDTICKEAITLDLLEQVLPLVASQDIFLSLGISLTSPPQTSISAMTSLPKTLPSLCYSLLYLSLLQLSSMNSGDVFKSIPKQLVTRALNLSGNKKDKLSKELKHYQNLLTDFHQGNQLSGLAGAGEVDVERFTSDLQYKEDTILGLAMFPDLDKWSLTLALARRYDLAFWPVYATHLQTLLTSGLEAGDAASLVEQRQLMTVLCEDSQRLEDWMQSRVLPLLDGNDTEMLLLYHSLLDHETRINALNVIKENGLKINFTLFEEGNQDIFKEITKQNVDTVAEVTDMLGTSTVTSSQIYKYWAFEMFLSHGKSKDNWIEAFSVCNDYMDRMSPEDARLFIKECLLSSHAYQHVPKPARGRIFKKAVKFVEVKIAGKAPGDWKVLEAWLEQVKEHTEKLKSPFSVEILKNFSEDDQNYVDELEMTAGEESVILKFLSKLIVTNSRTEVVENMIKLWKQDEDTVNVFLVDLLQAVIDQIADSGKVITEDPFIFIENLADYKSLPGLQLSSKLAPLCTNESIPVNQRLAFVKILKKIKTECEASDNTEDLDSSMLAALFEVQQDVVRILPDFVVDKSDIENNNTRWGLFEKFLCECSSSKQLLEVYDLIQTWENFEQEVSNDEDKNCLLKLSQRLIDLDPVGHDLLNLFRRVESGPGLEQVFPTNIGKLLVQYCETLNNQILFVKLVLQLHYEEGYSSVLKILEDKKDCDEECIHLIVNSSLLPRLISSSLYPHLVNKISLMDPAVGQLAAEQLEDAGHPVHAATFQMSLNSVPVGLRTISTMAQRLLFRKQ